MSINLKSAFIIALIITIIALTISTCSLSKRIDNAQKQLEQAQTTIETQSHEMQKYQNMCKLMQENERIKSQTVASFIETSKQSQDEHVQRIQTIETSDDSCGWLDMPVPDSVRLLFNAACSNGIRINDTAIGIDDAMRPAENEKHINQP